MNCPACNNLEGALAEAAFLTGMVRNSDAVIMTCYAPLLARLGYAQWSPDLIWFDEKAVYRTPSYFVQQMFSENLGAYNVPIGGGDLPCQASYDPQRSELILMLVNPSAQGVEIPLSFDGGWTVRGEEAEEILLTGETPADVNTLEAETVRPVRRRFRLAGSYALPPFAFAVVRIPAVNGREDG